jgi:hypothetical protein
MIKVYYIPDGPKNIASLFPSVDFDQVQEYYLEIQNGGGTVIATTPTNVIDNRCCSGVRLRFLNRLGKIDGLNFNLLGIEHDAISSTKQNATSVPLVKSQHSISRFDIRSNDTLTLSNTQYLEADQDWIEELVDSPLAWMEWKGIQGQSDDYIPVVVEDSKFLKRKIEDRYVYELLVRAKLSHERFIIRN